MARTRSKDPMKLLFSLTKKDFEVQTFCSGGKGGQHQNATQSGVRIIHRASGAVGECREERHQALNKRIAFERMSQTKEFKAWHMLECARHLGNVTIEDKVNAAMQPENLKVENY
jgi:protein subunit release factor B